MVEIRPICGKIRGCGRHPKNRRPSGSKRRPSLVPEVKQPKANSRANQGRQEPMMMAVTTAMPMVIVARAVVGMLGVMRSLRNFSGMLVLACLGLLYLHYLVFTRRCLRNLIGTLVLACLCLLYLEHLVLTRFSVWL